MSYYRDHLEAWLRQIQVKTPRVLDIGGASNPVKNRVGLMKTDDIQYLDNGAEEAKESYLPFDLNLPMEGQRGGYPKEWYQFGAVFCLEVFEYIWNPVQAITTIWECMNNDSICYISFPSIYPVHAPHEIDYLRYTQQAIKKYLSLYPFKNIEIIARKATAGRGDLARFYASENMHPLKHSVLPFDIGYLVKAQKITLANS